MRCAACPRDLTTPRSTSIRAVVLAFMRCPAVICPANHERGATAVCMQRQLAWRHGVFCHSVLDPAIIRHWFKKPPWERHWFKPNGGGEGI